VRVCVCLRERVRGEGDEVAFHTALFGCLHHAPLTRNRLLILFVCVCLYVCVCVCLCVCVCVRRVIQIAQAQNLEIRRMGNKWVGADGEELDVEVEEEEEIDLEYDSGVYVCV